MRLTLLFIHLVEPLSKIILLSWNSGRTMEVFQESLHHPPLLFFEFWLAFPLLGLLLLSQSMWAGFVFRMGHVLVLARSLSFIFLSQAILRESLFTFHFLWAGFSLLALYLSRKIYRPSLPGRKIPQV